MAFGKSERKGILIGRHAAISQGNDAALFKDGGGGCATFTSSSPSNASCKLELMIGDMTISLDAPSSLAGSHLSNHLISGGSAIPAPQALYEDDGNPLSKQGADTSRAVLSVPEKVEDQDVEELSSSRLLSCPLCSKCFSSEVSELGGTYKAETCGHCFCKDCHTNLVKQSLQNVASETASLDSIVSSLVCPVDICGEHFTQLDIEQAVGNSAFLQFQITLVALFSREFGAAWKRICPECSNQGVSASLVPITELECLGLGEVYRAMEARGLRVSGRSKEQGLQDLEVVTGALVASPWRLMCLTCDLVQCNACGLQMKGPISSSSARFLHQPLALDDFGIILQGREVSALVSEEKMAPACNTPPDGIHEVCEPRRRQLFSLFCAVMDINSAHEGLKQCLTTKESLHPSGSKIRTKQAAIWPDDAVKVDVKQELGTTDHPLSQSAPHCKAQILPLEHTEICSRQPREPHREVEAMLRMLLPAVEESVSPQTTQHPMPTENESVFLEPSPVELFSGTHGQVSTASTIETLSSSCALMPDTVMDIPISFPSLSPLLVHPDEQPLYFMNQGPGAINPRDYWAYKADTWKRASQYWRSEVERCAASAAWWDMECRKWFGTMAQTASKWAHIEAHWARSAEQAMVLNELWAFNLQEMSLWQANLARSGIRGPPCSLTRSFPVNQQSVQVLNLRTKSDVDEYPDSIGAETEWISPGGGEMELWSAASTASVPSASLGSCSNTRGSSPSSTDSPLDAGSSNVPNTVSTDKLADERLANALWALTDILEVNAALGISLPTLATFFLSGFKPLREVLNFLLENRSLPDIMAREYLYSEVFFLLRALSAHTNTLLILCMPNSCLSMQSNPGSHTHSSLFEALESLHWQAEDMLSEALVTVENDHDATRKNLNFIGDMEDAFDVVQASLECLQRA